MYTRHSTVSQNAKNTDTLSPVSSCQVLELICTREAGAVFEAGGLACVLSFIRDNASIIHKDTLHSAMSVVSRYVLFHHWFIC